MLSDICYDGEALNGNEAEGGAQTGGVAILFEYNITCSGTLKTIGILTEATGEVYVDLWTLMDNKTVLMYKQLLNVISAGISTFPVTTTVCTSHLLIQ